MTRSTLQSPRFACRCNAHGRLRPAAESQLSKDVTIGIDLGTSNSCVCAMIDGKPTVLANAKGERVIASVVAFHEGSKIEVGNAAKQRIIIDPKHTVSSAKRLIGRYFFSEEVR